MKLSYLFGSCPNLELWHHHRILKTHTLVIFAYFFPVQWAQISSSLLTKNWNVSTSSPGSLVWHMTKTLVKLVRIRNLLTGWSLNLIDCLYYKVLTKHFKHACATLYFLLVMIKLNLYLPEWWIGPSWPPNYDKNSEI